GTPFTAQAVKESWDRTRTQPASIAHDTEWNAITAITVVGTDQLTVTLNNSSSGLFLTRIAAVPTGPGGAPAAYAKYGRSQYRLHPVGAGPYAFDVQNSQVVSLRKWSGYWDPKHAQLMGGVDVIQTASGAPAVASMQTGQIQLTKVSVADTP